MDPYLSYTIHYIDSTTWELLSACLQVHHIPEDHTGVNLEETLAQTLTDWGLDANKQVALTTDNASNIHRACELLGWRQLSCFRHSLDLAVQKGLADRYQGGVSIACVQASGCCILR